MEAIILTVLSTARTLADPRWSRRQIRHRYEKQRFAHEVAGMLDDAHKKGAERQRSSPPLSTVDDHLGEPDLPTNLPPPPVDQAGTDIGLPPVLIVTGENDVLRTKARPMPTSLPKPASMSPRRGIWGPSTIS